MRPNSPHWQASCSVAGRQKRTTTKEESLARAKDVARDWYLGLLGKYRAGELKEGKTFKEAAMRFLDEYEVITLGQRNARHVENNRRRLENYLTPLFGAKVLSDITPGLVQDYRIHRLKAGSVRKQKGEDGAELPGKPPSRSTLHKEIVCIRQVLKTASRHGWLPYLPDLSAPYKTSGKVTHRAWFSPAEYKTLYEATRERAESPKRERWRTACETMHDFVPIMVNTGLRPDEALRLEFRDVAIVTDDATGERILEIKVRGKRGGSHAGGRGPFQTPKGPHGGRPNRPGLSSLQRELFNTLLEELDLKRDRDGQPRTRYSLRHTYICLRLMEGADIYQIAKNCRTSVEMIETFYASHIKNTLDAAAINVRRPKPTKAPTKKGTATRRGNPAELAEPKSWNPRP